MNHSIYCPREEVPSVCLTIVARGLIARHGKCGIGVFGTDMIINAESLRDLEPAMALTLAQVSSTRTTCQPPCSLTHLLA